MELTTACIFCTRDDQPPALFETEHLYVMPDKYPICPGHTLIISKHHFACYGAAPSEVQRELEETAALARGFLGAAYGHPLLLWENGVSGQSVYHAHLHLMPMALDGIPPELEAHADVTAIDGWPEVRERFGQTGRYRYLELGDARRLLAGHSPVLGSVVRMMAQATGLHYGNNGWVKTTTSSDVDELRRRFAEWRVQHDDVTVL